MAFEQCSPEKKEIDVVFPYSVIHFVLSGEGVINGQRITENMAFISFENNRLNYYPSRTDPWSYIYLRLRGDDVKRAFEEHHFSLGVTVVKFSNMDAIFQILSLYNVLSGKNSPDADKIIANAVFLLFESSHQIPPTQSKPKQHVEGMVDFIEKNYYKKISVEELAERFYLNKNYIRTIFVKELGLSPKQYIQKMRMERAAFLLTETNEDVSLVAKSVGYDDALLFSKMFKRYHELSPTEYRRQNR